MNKVELYQLVEKSKNSYSLFATEASINYEVEAYEKNCKYAKYLAEQGLLDYKTGYEGFVKKYDELLVSIYNNMINNPSYLITGSAGRSQSKHTKAVECRSNKINSLNELLDRLSEQNVDKLKNKIYKKSITPKSYKDKADKLLELYNYLVKSNEILKDKKKSLPEKFFILLDCQYMINITNEWYRTDRSNRCIPTLLLIRDPNIEVMAITEKQFSMAMYYIKVNLTGSIKKSTLEEILKKVNQLNELSIKYDNKEVIN